MIIIVKQNNVVGSLFGVFGPFDSVKDQKLKETFIKKGFLKSYEEEVELSKHYTSNNGVDFIALEIKTIDNMF